jgi:hypothetical protein
VPQQITITVRRQDEGVVSVTVGSIFGEATLTRRELEEMLAALQPDLSYENRTIRLKPGLTRLSGRSPDRFPGGRDNLNRV